MVKNSLMLFPSPTKNLFGLIGSHLLPKADCPTYFTNDYPTPPKLFRPVVQPITPHTPHHLLQKLIARRTHTPNTTPNTPHTPKHPTHQLHTNYTPAIHRLYTHPIPLPCELECSQTSTKWTPRVVQTRLERSSKAVCCVARGANEGR